MNLKKIIKIVREYISILMLHQKTFYKFRNIYKGKDVVLIATGPTLNRYQPIDNAIYVGVNKAFMFDKIKLDYLFMQDFFAVRGVISEGIEYIGNNCVKFFGTLENTPEGLLIPESVAVKAKARRYKTDYPNYPSKFTKNILGHILGDFHSVVFPAIQFILWTNPRKIYLVGCDCSQEGYFNNNKTDLHTEWIIEGWKELKKFAAENYPRTEIISINPIGLKGIFKEININNLD